MRKLSLFIAGLFLLSINFLCGQEFPGFNPESWDIIAGRADSAGGRAAFTGQALLKGIQFNNGTIEWDIFADGRRSYAGVMVRFQENRDYEEFYVRPHKANGLNADAFQYCPVYHGVSCWQLFYGNRGTREAVIPLNRWVHFKMVVEGNRFRVTMDNGEETSMLINCMDQEVRPGRIGIKGPADGSVWFSNFKVTDRIDEPLPEPLPPKPEEPGIVKQWEISQSFGHDRFDRESYYDKVENIQWRGIEPGAEGMVNLTRAVTRDMSQPGWLYARTFIDSESERTAHFYLGYSDYVTVFINGKPVFTGINAYTSRDPGFAGLMGYFDEVYLPLRKGSNEITLMVGEQFGGWGFMMKDADAGYRNDMLMHKWELKNLLNYTESVIYDTASGNLFVSNFLSSRGGYISKLSVDGDILEQYFTTGLRNPTGITILNDCIYVVERGGVVKVNRQTGEIITRIPIEGSFFPNDIAADNRGNALYVTDNDAGRIYRIRDDKPEVWMEGGVLQKPNGIDVSGDKIFVGCTGYPGIVKIDIRERKSEMVTLLHEGAIMDGIQVAEDGTIFYSDFGGYLYCRRPGGEPTLLLNTVTEGVSLADFELVEDKGLIVIPGLYSNVVKCYTVKGL